MNNTDHISPSISQTSSCCSSPHGQRMYSEKYGLLYMITSLEGKVALIGVTLSFLHCAGLIVSLYYLISTYLNNGDSNDDFSARICTDALLCLLFRFGPGLEDTGDTSTGLAGQVLYSLVALALNLVLVAGAMGRRPYWLLSWMVGYFINVLGCFVLAGILSAALSYRYKHYGDITTEEFCWVLVPLLLSCVYILAWIIVYSLYSSTKRVQNHVFSIYNL